MRILLYNWVQFDDVERRGGGVRIYQKNLIDHLVENTDHEVTVISGGLEHDAFDSRFRIEATKNELGSRVRSYAIVNSPVMAPGQDAFGSPDLFDESKLHVWHAFLRDGGYDVVQFDTLEGIPMTFLNVHEALPDAKVGVYFHNYYPVCPQVNLWKRETEHCADYREGADCTSCLPRQTVPGEVRRAHQISRVLRRSGITPESIGYKIAYKAYTRLRHNRDRIERVSKAVRTRVEDRRGVQAIAQMERNHDDAALVVPPAAPGMPVSLKLATRDEAMTATAFRERRERTAALVNTHADVVLATSERVGEVVAARGIDPRLVELSYIGTKVANEVDPGLRRRKPQVPGQLTMAYLGYMRPDKGFPFLIETLEQAPDDLLQRLRLVIGAKITTPQMERRLAQLATRMADLLHLDGYKHEQLSALLAPVDVGLVPVQWEDNLPQVALEMSAHGLPLVTSDRGGAQEVGGHAPGFVFRATDRAHFLEILRDLVEERTSLDSFWDHAMELTSMQRHVNRLLDLYSGRRGE